MKRFFDLLLKVFKPDKSKYVRVVQDPYPTQSGGQGFGSGKKKKSSNRVLAWALTSDILDNKEDKQGVSVDIVLRKDRQFRILKNLKHLSISSHKRGLTKVKHHVEFTLKDEDKLEFDAIISHGKSISFLYRTEEGVVLFLGERNGLLGIEDENGKYVFTGEENDVFFKVSDDCFYKLLPNID